MTTEITSLSVTFLTRSHSAKEVVLGPGHYLVGSDDGCDITLNGETVDPEHCILTWDGRRLFIEDLMSEFGVAVNSNRVTLAEITSRDAVRIGEEAILSFRRSSSHNGAMPPPENMVVEVYGEGAESGKYVPPESVAADEAEYEGDDDDEASSLPLTLRLAGDVAGFGLPEVLECICRSQRTGTLYVKGHDKKVAIYFRSGKAVYATPALPRDKIGEILLAKSLIQSVDLYDALKHQKKLKRNGKFLRLGTLLVHMGKMDAPTLKYCISEQIRTALNDIITETEGDFIFEPHSELEREDVVAEVDVGGLLTGVQEVKKAVEQGREVPLPNDIFEINGDPTAVKNINLGLNEWKILSLIDGERDIKTLSALAKFPIITIITNVIRFSELDLIRKATNGHKPSSNRRRKGILKGFTGDKGILKRLLGKLRGGHGESFASGRGGYYRTAPDGTDITAN
jgi:hypothetical protein